VLHVQQTLVVELDLAASISLEVDGEWRKADDSLEVGRRTVLDGDLVLVLVRNLGVFVKAESANDNPLLCLIVPLLPGQAAMSQFDLALLSLLLIDGDTGRSGFEERYG